VTAKQEVIDDEDSHVITAGAMVTVTVTIERKNMQVLLEKSISSSNAINQDELMNDENQKLPNHKNGDQNEPQQVKNKPPVWKKPTKKSKGKGKKKGPKKLQPFQQKQQNNPQNAKKKDSDNENADEQSDSASVLDSNENSDVENGSSTTSTNENKALVSNENSKQSKDKKSLADKNDSDEDEWDKFQEKVTKKEKLLESKSKNSHSVHCPFFSDDKQEYWWVYMVVRKPPSLMTIPVLITNLVDYEELELKFTAPTIPGTYRSEVVVRSDSYVDFVSIVNLKFEVKKAKVYKVPTQWDLSEDEEEIEDDAAEDSDLLDDSDLDSEDAITDSDDDDIEEVD